MCVAPAARTLDGDAAPVALVWDGNEWDAIRLTVDHLKSERPAKITAAAVFQVRVGSELSEAAFADFRRAFAAAKCEVSLEPDKISVRSPAITAGKTLAIHAEAPWTNVWTKPTRLEPASSSAILEIDGQDVGKKLLEAAR